MMISRLLVLAQFILIGLIVSPTRALLSTSMPMIVGLALMLLATAFALWALISMHPGTFRVLPEPASTGTLTKTGPYAFVRHPMYSAVVIGSFGACIGHGILTNWILLAGLVVVLAIKAHREEILLDQHYADYAQYKKHTKAFVPFVY